MPGSTMSHDIENRITQITGSFGTENYKYGPDNNRRRKTRGTSIDHYYFYGAYGELLGVYAPYSDGYSRGYKTISLNTYFAGKLIRSKQTDMFGTVTDAAVVVDRLGSVRKRSNVNVSVYQQFISYPFGEESTATENNREKYATYFRDKDTGLDYARNRYYASTMGRFLTPDPYAGSAKLGNPQSWNRYLYVNNIPTNNIDPSGLKIEIQFTDEGDGICHSFFSITPENQELWLKDQNWKDFFKKGQDGKYFLTVGAGPGWPSSPNTLVSDINRPRDVQPHSPGLLMPQRAEGEDAMILKILTLDQGYGDGLNYDLPPGLHGDLPENSRGYNSNSYISGLYEAAYGPDGKPKMTPDMLSSYRKLGSALKY